MENAKNSKDYESIEKKNELLNYENNVSKSESYAESKEESYVESKADSNSKNNFLKINDRYSSKPYLRGKIHAAAFIFCSITTLAYVMLAIKGQFLTHISAVTDQKVNLHLNASNANFGIIIYLFVQLIQFGISASYHILDLGVTAKRAMRRLDHMAIFLLISGTQTAVMLNSRKTADVDISSVLKWSWSVSFIGISKILFLSELHNILDLICYIGHGLLVVPFYRVIKNVAIGDLILAIFGGIFYILGGVIFGIEKPNPIPKVFGFHEIFHLCTVIANAFFGIIILRPIL